MLLITGSILFAIVLCASYFAVGVVARAGRKRNRVAVPNERSLHSEPVPYGAGLVIAVTCIVAYPAISYFVSDTFSWGYFTGACLITLVSYLDDVFSVPFFVRLLVHSLAAVLLIFDVDTWHGITALGNIHLGLWGYVITFLWIVWMVNAYNFMDGIDGLAGLQSLTAATGWLLLAYAINMPALYLFAGVLAASSLGFLLHNWHPARIFMGDVGSAFLGYTFAALPLIARHMAEKGWDLLPIAALLFVWFFMFDSTVTVIRRLFRGENVFSAHREHLFQRLVSSGLTHTRVTVVYGVLATLLSLSVLTSIAYREDIGLAMFPVVIILTLALLALCVWRGVLFKRVA
ncbi:MAG: glycosyltransferase family 4 protein [Acidobacteria bacterium]|nr:glycosyltransferase family 4 protein [Acidobacteriota bacterium]